MNLNPIHYFIKRYHSPNLKADELKRMLNLWFPFLVNRIKILNISEDFSEMKVRLKHSFWNRNPYKTVWGGSITSAMDPFYPIMMKQIMLRKGIRTDFFSKAINVEFIRKVNTNIFFQFKITEIEIINAGELLIKDDKYEIWHEVDGIDPDGNICVKGKIQVYLRKR